MEETEHKPSKTRRKKLVLAITTGVIILAVGFALWIFTIRDTGPIPRKYTKGLDLTLYYPTRLPSGYAVDPRSFERKENSIIFSISAPKRRNIAVSLQATPTDMPIQSAPRGTPVGIPGERNFSTGIGQAHLSLWGDKYVSDIVTTRGTWIILNVSGFTTEEATKITQSFTEL